MAQGPPRRTDPIFPESEINVVVVGGETNGYWRIMGAKYRKTFQSTRGVSGMIFAQTSETGVRRSAMRIFRTLCFVAFALAGALATWPTRAADFPDRQVHLLVPYAPGGGADIVGRLVAAKLAETWGQSVIVENKAGANGPVASEYVMQQPADGYTVVVGTLGSHAIMQYLNPKLGYDPLRDFAAVTVLVYSPLICLVAPSSPVHHAAGSGGGRQDQTNVVRQPRRRLADASDRRDVQSVLRHAVPARRLSGWRRRCRICSADISRWSWARWVRRNRSDVRPVAGPGGDRKQTKPERSGCPDLRRGRLSRL